MKKYIQMSLPFLVICGFSGSVMAESYPGQAAYLEKLKTRSATGIVKDIIKAHKNMPGECHLSPYAVALVGIEEALPGINGLQRLLSSSQRRYDRRIKIVREGSDGYVDAQESEALYQDSKLFGGAITTATVALSGVPVVALGLAGDIGVELGLPARFAETEDQIAYYQSWTKAAVKAGFPDTVNTIRNVAKVCGPARSKVRDATHELESRAKAKTSAAVSTLLFGMSSHTVPGGIFADSAAKASPRSTPTPTAPSTL